MQIWQDLITINNHNQTTICIILFVPLFSFIWHCTHPDKFLKFLFSCESSRELSLRKHGWLICLWKMEHLDQCPFISMGNFGVLNCCITLLPVFFSPTIFTSQVMIAQTQKYRKTQITSNNFPKDVILASFQIDFLTFKVLFIWLWYENHLTDTLTLVGETPERTPEPEMI